MMPKLASQIRVAFSNMELKTGSSLPGELEMTFSTSEVAVCCSSDSESSRVRACTSSNNQTFSISLTAWSAKVVTNSICLAVNGPGLGLKPQHDLANAASRRNAGHHVWNGRHESAVMFPTHPRKYAGGLQCSH